MDPVPPNLLSTQTFKSLPIIIGVLMIPLFIASVIGYYALSTIQGLGLAQGFAVDLLVTLKSTIQVFDTIVLLVFGVSVGAVVIRSFQVNTPMVFAVIGLFFLPVIVFSSAFLSNAVAIFANLSFMTNAANQFPMSLIFFQNAGLIAAGVGVLVLLVMVGGGFLRAQ